MYVSTQVPFREALRHWRIVWRDERLSTMVMNVKPIPTIDDRINDIRMRTAEIVNDAILPNEAKLWNLHREGEVSQHERRRRSNSGRRSSSGCGRRGCGLRTSRKSTAGWASTSSPTHI